MKTCPNCGAENLQTAVSCRLCAIPIEGPDKLMGVRADVPMADTLPSTNIVSGQEPADQHAPASTYAGHSVCPNCQGVNDADWMYCQQCGMRLPPQQQTPEAGPGAGERRAGPSGESRAGVATRDEFKTVRDTGEQDSIETKHMPQSTAPQPSIRQEAAAPKEFITHREKPETSKVAPGEEVQPDLPPPVQPEPAPPAPPEREENSSLSTKAVCPKCGTIQSPDGSFCLGCGAPMGRGSSAKQKEPAAKEPAAAQASGVLKLITEGGQPGDAYSLDRNETTIGRMEGEVTFPYDGFMSNRHARVIRRDGRYFIVDEGSRNGTFIRITGEVTLDSGDQILAGKQIFKFVLSD